MIKSVGMNEPCPKVIYVSVNTCYLYLIVPDLCKKNPCENGGICVQVGSDYKCICAYGYKGINCRCKFE